MAGLWMSRLLKTDLLEDVFNVENESFMQETELKENEYSVNLRTRFWFRGRAYDDGSTLSIPSVRRWSWARPVRASPMR